MIRRDARPLRPVQHRRRAAFIDDVVPRVLKIRALLLPEEEDAEAGQERREAVVDALQDLRVLLQGAQEGRVGGQGFFRQGDGRELLEAGEEVRAAGAEVRGAEEEEAVGAGVDGVDVGDFGGGARGGVGEGGLDDDAAERVAEEDDGARFSVFELWAESAWAVSLTTGFW